MPRTLLGLPLALLLLVPGLGDARAAEAADEPALRVPGGAAGLVEALGLPADPPHRRARAF